VVVTDIDRERDTMKPAKVFDETKLTAEQRQALAIAKSQGKKLHLTRADLLGSMDAAAVDDLLQTILDLRREDRQRAEMSPID
jgi:hypothetical protein